jgi:peptidoglycan/xylan/chitin deacetylase (PgdA/CDA1 family)
VSERTKAGKVSEPLRHLQTEVDLKAGQVSAFTSLKDRDWVLAYHEILRAPSKYLYGVSRAQLEEHTSLFAPAASGITSGMSSPRITFDDGHRSNYETAYPLLEQYGLRATFFVLAGCLGGSIEYLSWSQAREMVASGHRVQSHGWSHRLLTQCGPRELEEELSRSKQELENRLGIGVDSFSAPGGRWNERIVAAAARAGYKFMFHSNPWMRPQNLEGVRIQGRLMVTSRMDGQALRKQMQTSEPLRIYLLTKYHAKERMRGLLGEGLYHRLWCWLANFDPENEMEVRVNGQANGMGGSGRA